jgi:hypothetical protein
MKINPTAVNITCAVLLPIAASLIHIRKRTIRIFATFLLGFLILEITQNLIGVGEALWWIIHTPSVIALGDEIVERHGILISTAGHVADLFLWSAVFSLPIAFKAHKAEKDKRPQPPA